MTRIDHAELGARIAARQDEVLDDCGPSPTIRRHLAELATGGNRPPKHRARGPALVIALAALATLGIGVAWRHRAAKPLGFAIGDDGQRGVVGELVSASAARVPIRFSEGTSLWLEPKASVRIVRLGAHGAELVVETGRVNVSVVPRNGNDWLVRSGPFTVRVTGTQFDVGFDPALDRFTLRLYQGRVSVSGCGIQERALSGGEQMTATCARHEVTVTQLDPASTAIAPAVSSLPAPEPSDRQAAKPGAIVGGRSVAPSSKTVDRAPSASDGRERAEPKAALRSWIDLAQAGKYGEAYELVRESFSAECATSDPERALLLGETARLSGHASEARRAYTALRDHFGDSAQAAQAAFALGRLALDAGDDSASAEHWFNTYLQERPRGPLASAALGRLLELRLKVGDRAGAAVLAHRYLEQYPSGPRAEAARQLLEAAHVEEQR